MILSLSLSRKRLHAPVKSVDLTLDNASGYYTTIWYLERGTPIVATITTTDWNQPGDNHKRTTGTMWVDTTEWELKPSQVTFKATSISPDLLNDQVNHQAYEGQSQQTIFGIQAEELGTKLLSGTSSGTNALTGSNIGASGGLPGSGSEQGAAGANGADEGSITTSDMRTDQDNQGNLSFMQDQAALFSKEPFLPIAARAYPLGLQVHINSHYD